MINRGIPSANVDLSSILKPSSHEAPVSPSRQLRPASVPPGSVPNIIEQQHQHQHQHPHVHVQTQLPPALMPNNRRSMTPHVTDQPVKKQSKWSAEEDALIIELRGSGMKWEDVSKRLRGRSAISCRLHYQNYLERRSEWDEERKNKLARLYERFKADMWAKVAEELAVPWRAAEAMHWQLGESDMARRAGVTLFSLAAVNVDASSRNHSPRGHAQTQSHDATIRDMRPSSPRTNYGRGQVMSTMPTTRSAPRRPGPPMHPSQPSSQPQPILHPQSQQQGAPPPPPPPPLAPQAHTPSLSHVGMPHQEFRHSPGPGLAPIQTRPQTHHSGPLPGVAQLTGMNSFGSPSGPPSGGPLPTINTPGGHMAPRYPMHETTGSKRRASPDMVPGESSHKRRM